MQRTANYYQITTIPVALFLISLECVYIIESILNSIMASNISIRRIDELDNRLLLLLLSPTTVTLLLLLLLALGFVPLSSLDGDVILLLFYSCAIYCLIILTYQYLSRVL